jgi:hypothetical protein
MGALAALLPRSSTTIPHKISISNLLAPLNPPQHLPPLAVPAVGRVVDEMNVSVVALEHIYSLEC